STLILQSSSCPWIILTSFLSVCDLLWRRRRKPALSAGKANVTAIISSSAPTGCCHQSCFDAGSTIWTTKLFFPTVAAIVDPGSGVIGGGVCVAVEADDARFSPAIDAIAVRNSDSRFGGISTTTLSRWWPANPFVAEPPTRVAIVAT